MRLPTMSSCNLLFWEMLSTARMQLEHPVFGRVLHGAVMHYNERVYYGNG